MIEMSGMLGLRRVGGEVKIVSVRFVRVDRGYVGVGLVRIVGCQD